MTTLNFRLEWALILFLPMTFTLGLCYGTRTVALQDLTAKTFDREGMRKILSLGNAFGGLLTLVIAALAQFLDTEPGSANGHLIQIWIGATLYVISGLFFLGISEKESPARLKKKTSFNFWENFLELKNSTWYMNYLGLQTLFLSVSLAVPFYSIHATTLLENSATTLSVLIIAMALGALVSKNFWDSMRKRGTRFQFVLSAVLAGAGAFYSLIVDITPALQIPYYHAPAFFLIGLAVKGLAVAQTIYLNDNVSAEERPKYLGMNGAFMSLFGIVGSFAVGVLATLTDIKYGLMVLLILNIMAGLFASFPSSLTTKNHSEAQ